ncbi:hypothetical protein AS594_39565 [Streptomyces agglomeratus]|uniref:Uncharacterized protein n=1 Tax=Streptomyces agglomeratus TaxID=285458 RepID=A0A1E5NZ81_9ACTN|nr:hypothetical protein [Streptomyces agglomeratus]OEJ21625.1 hypothetical protein AS594_39565 [Streptomyces agglomeratus]
MPTVTPTEPVGTQPAAPAASGHLGAAEAAVVVSAIAAATVLAALERPVPAVLTAIVAALTGDHR